MKQGFHICLYKKTGNPIIYAYVENDEAEIVMSLDDFVEALKQEIGSVTWTFKDDTFKKQVDDSISRIVRQIKCSVVKII